MDIINHEFHNLNEPYRRLHLARISTTLHICVDVITYPYARVNADLTNSIVERCPL